MSIPDPLSFSADWVAAWNAHDVEAVLAHFHDDVVFTSPTAARVVPTSGGVTRGKQALREYWTEGLKLMPDLHFTVERVLAGVGHDVPPAARRPTSVSVGPGTSPGRR